MPDFIKVLGSLWILVTCIFWLKVFLIGRKQNKFTTSAGVFAAGLMWLCSGIAPIFAIKLVWAYL